MSLNPQHWVIPGWSRRQALGLGQEGLHSGGEGLHPRVVRLHPGWEGQHPGGEDLFHLGSVALHQAVCL